MDNATFTTLTRQSGLMQEMQAVANNIANASTTGYRKEGIIFSEHVERLGDDAPSLSMARAAGRVTSPEQGAMVRTGGTFDIAIQGDGFFVLETEAGERLTRAGSFTPDAAGELVDPQGNRLLDAGGAPIFVPPQAGDVVVGADGTLSADGFPIAQIGIAVPAQGTQVTREAGVRFAPDGPIEPLPDATVKQGYLEDANVDPVAEIARMIEVQRAYELGQKFLEREDERVRGVIQTLGR